MGSWTANRLRAMLCGRLSIDEINIISEKHGGPDTMFAMVRSLDEEQAKIFLYNILNEGLSARLSAFAETVNVSENDLQQVIDQGLRYGGAGPALQGAIGEGSCSFAPESAPQHLSTSTVRREVEWSVLKTVSCVQRLPARFGQFWDIFQLLLQ